MKAIQFANVPSTPKTWAFQTVVMDDGTVWIRYLNEQKDYELIWGPWEQVPLPTESDKEFLR